MRFRHRATKPSIALWMVVAIGDLALLVASVGMTALVALASVVIVAAGTVGGWMLLRRGMADRNLVPARMTVPATARPRTDAVRRYR